MRRPGLRLAVLLWALAAARPGAALAPLAREPGADRERPPRLRFDPDLGVHVVVGRDALYYFDRAFIRLRRGSWQFAASVSGPWRERPREWVPLGLRLRHFAEER